MVSKPGDGRRRTREGKKSGSVLSETKKCGFPTSGRDCRMVCFRQTVTYFRSDDS